MENCSQCGNLLYDDDTSCGACGVSLQAVTVTKKTNLPRLPIPRGTASPNAIYSSQPAFSEPTTPTFHNKAIRIAFAVFASPIIGIIIGGTPCAWIGLGISAVLGLSNWVGIVTGIVGAVSLTILTAYVILADKIPAFLTRDRNEFRDAPTDQRREKF